MFRTSSISVLAIVLATATQAGSIAPTVAEPMIETPTYAPVAAVDWTGGYVGFSAVGGHVESGPAATDTRGFGLQAGYLRDLGGFVLGGELAYVKGEPTDSGFSGEFTSTRLKAIGGYNAGKFLPYVTLGMSQLDGEGSSDTAMLYGVGGKYAFNNQWAVGLEYIVEQKDNFDNSGFDVDNQDVALRVDYRF
jgi:opacity protein-like surface antigen